MPGVDEVTRQCALASGHVPRGSRVRRVWIVFAMVALLYVDQAGLSEGVAWLVRIAFAVAPILMPLGFFLSVLSPRADRPNGIIALVYLGGLSLAVGALTLGIGFLVD